MIQPSSCQTTSDSTEDVVILETNPFEFSTVESYPRTSATRYMVLNIYKYCISSSVLIFFGMGLDVANVHLVKYRAQSRSGTEEVFPNLQRRAKQEVPSEGTCPSENPIRNGAYSESNHDMIQGAARSKELHPLQVIQLCLLSA